MMKKLWKCTPLFARCMLAIGAISGILHLLSRLLPTVADFCNRYIGGGIRWILGVVSSALPFSLAEMLLLLSPLWVGGLIWLGFRNRKTGRSMVRFLSCFLGAILLLYTLFVFTLGCGYGGTPLAEKMELSPVEITEERLYQTALWLVEETNERAASVSFGEDGFSVMPYSLGELSGHLRTRYGEAARENAFLSSLPSRVKPILLSRPMTYTNISGVYSFMTGEANVNVHYPDYTVAFTAAHEMAHQRGISREDEANFIAFWICIGAEDAYIQYAGYLNLLEYVLNALYKTDAEKYFDAFSRLDSRVVGELKAYSTFYKQYQNTVIGQVSESINNGYLVMNGTAGTVTYELVVDLAVAYHEGLRK